MASGFVTTLLNVAVMIISYPLYLHFLGYENVGVWFLLSSVQIFAQLGLAGIGPVLTKLVAEERGRSDNRGAQQYLSLATLILLAAGFAALVALTVFRVSIVHGLGLVDRDAAIALRLLPWVGALTAFSFLNQVTFAGLAGVGRMDVGNYCITASKLVALSVEALLLFRGFGIVTLLIGDFVGCATIHFLGNYLLRAQSDLRMLRGFRWDQSRFRRLIHFGGNMFLASLTTLLVSPLNKIALSQYHQVLLVPVYDMTFNGAMQLRGLVEVGLRAIMPAVSERSADVSPQGRLSIRRLHARSFGVMLLVCVPAYAVALPLSAPLLKLWLGQKFVASIVPTFQIMLGAAVINLAAVPAYYTLMGSGKMRSCMISHVLSAVANVAWLGGAIAVHGTVSIYDAAFAVVATMTASSVYLLGRTFFVLSSTNP